MASGPGAEERESERERHREGERDMSWGRGEVSVLCLAEGCTCCVSQEGVGGGGNCYNAIKRRIFIFYIII